MGGLSEAVVERATWNGLGNRDSRLDAVLPTCHLRPTTYEDGIRDTGGKLPIDDFRLPIFD